MMRDEQKTKAQLIAELKDLRRRVDLSRFVDFCGGDAWFSHIMDHVHAAWRHVPAITYLARANDRRSMVYLSPLLASVLGYEPEEVIDIDGFWYQRLHPTDRSKILKKMAAAMKQSGSYSVTYRLMNRQGRTGWFQDTGAAIRDENGTPVCIGGFLFDITEFKTREKKLKASKQKLLQLVDQLSRANEALRAEIEQRQRTQQALKDNYEQFKTFAYSIVHDLKSPTIGIYGLTRKLHETYFQQLGDHGKNYCQQILKASEHVTLLVERINAYVSSKESLLKPEPVNLCELLAAVREEFAGQLEPRGIRWIQPQTPLTITGDRVSLQRIFRNLVDNALKYGGEKLSRLVFDYHEETKEYHVIVADDGTGIPMDDAERLFELFQRHDTARTILGAGLGLAIVREIVGRHGGAVWLETGNTGGAVFHLTIAKPL
jgi:PAS domain S-box-containing protein